MSLLDSAIVRALPAVPKPVVRRLSARYIAGPELGDARRVVAELNAAGQARDGGRARRGDHARRRGPGDHAAPTWTCSTRSTPTGSTRTSASSSRGSGSRSTPASAARTSRRSPSAARSSGSTWRTRRRPTRRSSSTATSRTRASRISASCSRRRSSGRRTTRAHWPARTSALQGDLHRAARDLLPRLRRHPGELRPHTRALLDGGGYVGIATHDEWLVEQGLRAVRSGASSRTRTSSRCCSACARELGDRLVRAGHGLRIYVPFGRQWYEYSLRRLQENPKIAGYVAGDLGRSIFRRR